MPAAECGLCRETRDLHDSHFMPRALYKLLRDPSSKNPHPVVVGPSVAMTTPQQAKDEFLCEECETRLNQGGEAWVLSHCWRSEGDFCLLTALSKATPVWKGQDDVVVFEGDKVADVDASRLVYFGASVFWRAAAHNWGPLAGHEPVRLRLGPYEEGLRRFLLSEAEFPRDAVILVTVNSTATAERNQYAVFPWLKRHETDSRTYQCVIPGVSFTLLLGKALSTTVRRLCTWRSPGHWIYFSSHMEARNLADMAGLVAGAETVGSLASAGTPSPA